LVSKQFVLGTGRVFQFAKHYDDYGDSKMRLIEKQVKAHPDTFAPELVVTIALPMQPADKPNEVRKSYEQWGQEFLDVIGAKAEQ
jgi:hypothetical protein